MAFSIVRSLFDVLRERDEEERDRQEVRQQASFFRRFGRMGEAERAANLFPLGMDYERARLEDTGLRPNRFVQQLREEPLPDYQAMAFRGEELPPSFQPIEAPQPLVPPGAGASRSHHGGGGIRSVPGGADGVSARSPARRATTV
jgi:hypothetical protein